LSAVQSARDWVDDMAVFAFDDDDLIVAALETVDVIYG
jgi:hypothetical protein